MEKYRIKIETLNNDKIWYYPEVKTGIFSGWKSLDDSGKTHDSGFFSLRSLEGAESCISIRKSHIKQIRDKSISSIKYIYK